MMDTPKETPEFQLDGNRYDQSTYKGRFKGFIEVIDPRCLMISDQELQHSISLLKTFEDHVGKSDSNSRLPDGITDEQLWQAKRTKDAVIHPSTGEKIPAPFRMAGFLPANVPLVAGMLNFTSIPATIFWQWANQSFNSALNYSNRSGSDVSIEEIGKSYAIAVGVSCSLALGFRQLGNKGPKFIRGFASIPFVVPFVSVASAGSANVYFSRLNELQNGVKVFDENNSEKGISRVAAQQGVIKTILSRSICLPIPVLVLPYLLMKLAPSSLGKTGLMLFELAAITGSIAIGLPAAIAIFPQKLEFDPKSLEDEFHNLKDENGKPISKLFSNKGL